MKRTHFTPLWSNEPLPITSLTTGHISNIMYKLEESKCHHSELFRTLTEELERRGEARMAYDPVYPPEIEACISVIA